jgi:hypothetical protein
MESDDLQPIIVPPGSGKVLKFLGVTHKLTQHQTGGAYYLFEAEFIPRAGIGCMYIATRTKSYMFWKVQSRSDSGTKNYKLARAV